MKNNVSAMGEEPSDFLEAPDDRAFEYQKLTKSVQGLMLRLYGSYEKYLTPSEYYELERYLFTLDQALGKDQDIILSIATRLGLDFGEGYWDPTMLETEIYDRLSGFLDARVGALAVGLDLDQIMWVDRKGWWEALEPLDTPIWTKEGDGSPSFSQRILVAMDYVRNRK